MPHNSVSIREILTEALSRYTAHETRQAYYRATVYPDISVVALARLAGIADKLARAKMRFRAYKTKRDCDRRRTTDEMQRNNIPAPEIMRWDLDQSNRDKAVYSKCRVYIAALGFEFDCLRQFIRTHNADAPSEQRM